MAEKKFKPIDSVIRRANHPKVINGCPECIYEIAGSTPFTRNEYYSFACAIDKSHKGDSPCMITDYAHCPLNEEEK